MGSKTVVKERKPEASRPAKTEACTHHWLIESPQGALSSGRCKRCGEERQFRNSANDYIWDDDSSSGYRGLGVGRSAPKAAVDDEDMTAASDPDRGEVALAV